jgi:hypothetical protein
MTAMEDRLPALLDESGLQEDDELTGLLAELAELGTTPAPVPGPELAALLVGGAADRRGLRRRGAVVGALVVLSIGCGVTAAAASPAVREGAAGMVTAVVHVLHPRSAPPRPHRTGPPAPTPAGAPIAVPSAPSPHQPVAVPAVPVAHPSQADDRGAATGSGSHSMDDHGGGAGGEHAHRESGSGPGQGSGSGESGSGNGTRGGGGHGSGSGSSGSSGSSGPSRHGGGGDDQGGSGGGSHDGSGNGSREGGDD